MREDVPKLVASAVGADILMAFVASDSSNAGEPTMTGQPLASRVALLWTAFGLVVLAVFAGVIAWKAAEGAGPAAVQRIDIGTSDTRTPPTAAPLILKPLSEQDARAENAALPLSTEPLEAAMPFRIGSATAAVIARSAARDWPR